MRRLLVLLIVVLGVFGVGGPTWASGPSGSTECHVADDDCDGRIDEDAANGVDDDGDGRVDEDAAGDAADDAGENQVSCSDASQDVGGAFTLYAGSNGAEACADDGSSVPVDGRVIATSDDGGYVAADGDGSNPEQAQGYARVDGEGPHCGDDSNQDSTSTDQSANTPEDCNADESA